MAPKLRARGNAQGSKIVASNGRKRKRDETSDSPSNFLPKKRKGKQSVVTVPDKQTDSQKAVVDEAIIEEFRIKFHPHPFDPQHPGNVPEEHQTKFKHIQQLGEMKYNSYALQPRPDSADKPWELDNKTRAKWLTQKAAMARRDYLNEDTWRMELENDIFKRFQIEVACQQCRKRLWRSLVEVKPTESNSRTTSLAKRQEHRSVCNCEPLSRQYSISSTGLSKIFSTRIEERSVIQDDPENHYRIEMRPDRIHGLRITKAMDKILMQPPVSRSGKDPELEDVLLNRLTISCNPESSGSMYPFLVMEAKSLKGQGNFQKIENQTAVPIRNHLYLQLKLEDDEFNKMKPPGGPLTWFLAYVGEAWRVYGCYVTRSRPNALPDYNVVLLWEGSITGQDAALQLVLIMDYIVDWARDIFRPGIMRQVMSVVDKGSQSAYTIVEGSDILSLRDYANSWSGDRPVASISGAEATEVDAKPVFDALDFTTIESPLEPLFKSAGKHVDIRVWEGAKYESRVRGLYIAEDDTVAQQHFTITGYRTVHTTHSKRCWFTLASAQDLKIIEQAWTGSQEIKDVQGPSKQRILCSLYVRYRKDYCGMPIREMTYLAVTEPVAKRLLDKDDLLKQNEQVVSAEELALKLPETWASSQENYFRRYASDETSMLRITAFDFNRLSDRVDISFHDDRDTKSYARRLDSFIKITCENSRSGRYKIYAPCFRYTKAVHLLTVEPHCIPDPTQACIFINTTAMSSGICAYVTNAASEEVNHTSVIRQLVQILAVLWKSHEGISSARGWRTAENKILLWIVSDPQWDSYIAIKSTLTTAGMSKIHTVLACFRKALLRHKCAKPGIHGREDWYKWRGHRRLLRFVPKFLRFVPN